MNFLGLENSQMKLLTGPHIVIALILIALLSVASKIFSRLISMILIVVVIAVTWYLYTHNGANIIPHIRNFINTHLQRAK